MALGALLFALAGVGALASERGAPGPALLVPFVVAGLFALTGLTKPVLRTTVTDREVYALHGLRESRIPLASITSVTVVPATRQSLLGAEALGPAAGAQMVLVAFDDLDGAAKKRAIPSVDPAALAAILEEARGRARESTGVRAEASVHEPSSVASDPDGEEAGRSQRAGARDSTR
jgi:hypothetical protein